MKTVIRRGVFETNSSSTHSITMVSQEDYDKWGSGEVLFSRYNDEFVPREKVLEEIRNDCPDFDFSDEEELAEAFRDLGYQTENDYDDEDSLETFYDTYTTKSGEKVIAFGKYGTDN